MRLEYFELVDRIVQLDLPGRRILTESTVPDESPIFEGHFPGYPLMPGVMLIEAMAQTSGWLIIGATRFERMPFLAAVKEAKLRTFVRPAARLAVSAKLIHEGSGFAVTEAAISVDGKNVCDSTLTFRIAQFPAPHFRAGMEAIATRIGFPLKAMADG